MNRRACLELLERSAERLGGLALVRASNGVLGRNSIYVLLGALEDDGYVRAFQPQPDTRRLYEITSAGRAALLRDDL